MNPGIKGQQMSVKKMLKQKAKLFIVIIVVVIIVLTAYYSVLNPSSAIIFRGNMKILNIWNSSSYTAKNEPTYITHCNISIQFYLPYKLDPNRVEFLVSTLKPVMFTFNGSPTNKLMIKYHCGTVPELTATSGIFMWPGAWGNIMNPDGRTVEEVQNTDSFIDSGAILQLNIVSSAISTTFNLTMIYQGAFGNTTIIII